MAAPLFVNTIKTGARAGQKLYRQGSRFISKAKYELEQRRLPSGRFGTRQQANFGKGFSNWMRAEVGPPNGGLDWAQIASKYPEKLENYIQEYRRQF